MSCGLKPLWRIFYPKNYAIGVCRRTATRTAHRSLSDLLKKQRTPQWFEAARHRRQPPGLCPIYDFQEIDRVLLERGGGLPPDPDVAPITEGIKYAEPVSFIIRPSVGCSVGRF